jgi:hypothetical protein
MIGKYLVYRAGKRRAHKKLSKKLNREFEALERSYKNSEDGKLPNESVWDALARMFSGNR